MKLTMSSSIGMVLLTKLTNFEPQKKCKPILSSHNGVALPSMHKLKCKMGMFLRSKILGHACKQLDPNVK